jgi:hypothetical protein
MEVNSRIKDKFLYRITLSANFNNEARR